MGLALYVPLFIHVISHASAFSIGLRIVQLVPTCLFCVEANGGHVFWFRSSDRHHSGGLVVATWMIGSSVSIWKPSIVAESREIRRMEESIRYPHTPNSWPSRFTLGNVAPLRTGAYHVVDLVVSWVRLTVRNWLRVG